MEWKIFLTHSIIALIAFIFVRGNITPENEFLGWLVLSPILTWPLMVITIIWI